MKDQSILNSAGKKGESYLDDLAFAVCVNGESIEKYKKIVEKKYGTDVYSNMVQFSQTLQQQVSRRQFTNTSLLSLKHLGKNAGMSEDAINMITDHFKSKIKDEQKISEETAFWQQCNPNDKRQLNEYLRKYPSGMYVTRAKSLISILEKIEREAIEESRIFNQCHTQRDYTDYLSKYPNGAYSAKAKSLIEEFGRKEIEENRVYNLCNEKKDYLDYLKKYPNGRYAKEAQAKIKTFDDADHRKREETEYWNKCNHNDKQSLKDYLKKYPNGIYAIQARSKIAEIERIEREAIEESRMFNQCRTRVDYKDYLHKYPTGQYVKKAIEKIKEFDSASRLEKDMYVSEQESYKQCKTKDDFLRYLNLYPNGMYVNQARNKIEHLEKIEKIKKNAQQKRANDENKEKQKSEKESIKDKVPYDKSNWVLNIVSFLFPIVGWLLFFVLKYALKKPVMAKACAKSSFIGILFFLIISVLI